jgi:XRE family transcriptional regulator, regulator of sulfur utilization
MPTLITQPSAIRCSHCRLMQFHTANNECRRCHQPLRSDSKYAGTIGVGIRMLRQQHGLSQEQLAAALSTQRSYISTIERGASLPSILTIERIAGVFSLDIADVFLMLRRMQRTTENPHIVSQRRIAA